MEISKKDYVINMVKEGNFKKALSTAKSFKREFSTDEQRTIQIASDCMNGNSKIYSQMGINTMEIIEKAKQILIQYSK